MSPNYTTLIDGFLFKCLTDDGYDLYRSIVLPDINTKLTSSSGKFHQKEDGRIPSQGEHIYNMLKIGKQLFRMLNLETPSRDRDVFLLALTWHDAFKYGATGKSRKTIYTHDKDFADYVERNRNVFEKHFTARQVELLIECIRFHSGRWSTDARSITSMDSCSFMATVVHVIDMGETNNIFITEEHVH